jgi:hypothetical protein
VRSLRAGADVEPTVVEPRNRTMCLEMNVLYAMRRVGALVDDVGLFESILDVANLAVDFDQDVSSRKPDARFAALVMNDGSARGHRFFGIKNRGEHFVVDLDLAASFFGRAFGVRDDRDDPLPDESHDVVEQVSVVGIGVIVVVSGRRV